MRKLKLIFACLLMAVLSIGQMWGEDVTIQYTNTTTTTNMTGNNDAATVGLDATHWSVVGAKGGNSNFPGLNKSKYIALYYNATASNTLTVTNLDDATINSIKITYSGTYNNGKVLVGGSEVTGTNGEYEIEATSFVITNGNTSNVQVRISKIEITYTPSGGGLDPSLSASPTSLAFGKVDQNASVAAKTFTLTGSNLTDANAVSITAPSGYTVSPTSVSPSSGSISETITVTPVTTTAGTFNGNITISSSDLSGNITVGLSMTVEEPFDGLKLTFDVSSNPGEWPTANSTTTTNYTYTLNSTDYTFALNNVKCNSGYLMLTQPAVMGLPAISGYKLVKVEATNSGGCSTTTKVKVTEDEAGSNVVSGGAEQTWGTVSSTYTYTLSGTVANTMYYLIVGNKNCQIVSLTLYYEEAEAPSVSKPTISGTENFLESTTATLACTTDGATIYYTTDNSDPKTSGTKQTYSAPFGLTATATVRAIAELSGSWSEEATSKTFTKGTKLTVTAAIALIPNANDTQDNQFVEGIVCTAGTSVSSGKMTYYISADGSETNRLQIYHGKNLNNTNFAAATDLVIGDRVVVFGQLKNFNGTPEMNEGNYLVSKEAPAVEAPVFSPDGGGFMGETNVTITCETASSAIYYTLDGETPSKSSTPYTAAIHLDATTTIKAIAYVGDDASIVITKTFTLSAPMTVAEALAALDTESPINNVAVAGIISTAPTANPSSGRLTYYISDDGTDANQLEVFNGYGLNGASFSNKTDLQVGDQVTVFGNLTIFSSTTKEFATGSRLLAFNRPAVAITGIDLTESTAEVEVGSTVTLHASVVPGNATDQGIVWSVTSGSDKASVDENGVVTGLAEGTAVIRAASHEDATIYAECTVTVTAVDPTIHHVTFDATVDLVASAEVEQAVTKSGITVATSDMDGVNNTSTNSQAFYQTFKNESLTISSTVGYIKKIEFTCEDSYGTAGYGMASDIWTGNAESVELTASVKQVRIKTITVTYKEDNRAAAGLAWNPAGDIELTVGEALSAPALLNPNNIDAAEITIASDNTDLATVSAGVVSLVANATGTATITATFAGNETYKPATISYTIIVSEPNVTFDSSIDHAESGELTITKGGITLSFTSGSLDEGTAEYRLYKSQTMTLSSTDYLIKKIEFTCASGYLASGFADATGLDKTNSVWTGESNTVELIASNAQVRMTKIKVFYVEDTRAAAGLAWSPAEDITLTVGEALSAPALLNPYNIAANEITIESSKTTVATVSEGVVSLVENATGTTTITASFPGNASYKPASVSYKITVNAAHSIYVSPSLYVNFGSVNKDEVVADKKITVTLTGVDAATLTLAGDGASAFTISPAAALTASGDVTISASSATVGTFAATLTISDDDNNAESKVVNLSITVANAETPETPVSTTSKWIPATEVVNNMQVLIVGVNNTDYYAMGAQTNNNRSAVAASVDGEGVLTPGTNTMAFTVVEQPDGTFALRTSNDKYLYAASSGSNWLRSQDELDDNGKWTLTIDGAIANGSNTRNTMQFNSGSSCFACYGSASQKKIALYVPKPTTPEPPTPAYTDIRTGLTAGNYFTICWPKAMTAIKGATLWSFAGKDVDFAYIVKENAPFEAGKPYLAYATADKLEAVLEGDDALSAGENNGLHGTFDNMDADALEAAGATYMLYQNALRPIGTNNHLNANRAYIVLSEIPAGAPSQMPGREVRKMPMQGTESQGVDNINASETPVKMMIDGQLFIIRGEKMYDATGRLVK